MIIKNICIFLLLFYSTTAQIVSTKDVFPNGENDITIIVDLKLAKDVKATALLGKTTDVYFWSGVGDEENGNAFKYTPNGQTDFNKPFEPGKMTSLGNDKWSIIINPRKFYNVPIDKPIVKMGIVIKNGPGNAQTEDLFLKLYGGKLEIVVIKPSNNTFVLNEKNEFDLKIKLSRKVDLSITTQIMKPDSIIENYSLGNYNQVDSLETKVSLTKIIAAGKAVTNIELKIIADTPTETVSESLTIYLKPLVEMTKLPASIKDGLNYLENGSVILSLFAPLKSFVYVLGDFNNWERNEKYLMKVDTTSNRFWIEIDGLTPQKEYAYQYLIDGSLAIADPYSEKILDPKYDSSIPTSTYPNLMPYPSKAKGIVSILQTGQKPFEWKASNFERPKSEKLIVYELLIRDFTAEGTYKAAQSKIPYLKNLGINAIELMPVSEFTANDSWGYNPTFYLAPDKAYGTKEDLKTFIDECHKNGIAVIIDMVLNQADDAFPYVQMYFEKGLPSKESPFFNPTATHPFSVFRDFNHESTATQSLVDQVNKYWLEEFKIDGFRFDLSKGFTQKVNTDVEKWSAYDASRVKIWKRIYDKIRGVDKTAYVILEHFAANNEEQELAEYGMMFWGNANGDYRNTLKGETANLANLSHQIRAWNKPNLIGYMESHDEERLLFDLQKNGPILGTYSTKDLSTALERAKAAAALFFLTEGPKMIWQFGELGYDISIDQNGRTGKKPIKWEYFDEPSRKKLYQVYSEMIKLKRILEFDGSKFNYRLSGKFKQTTIENKEIKTIILANFDLEKRSENLDFEAGIWYDYFTGIEFKTEVNDKIELKPGEFHIYTNKKLTKPEAGIVPWQAYTREQILANEPFEFTDFQIFPNPATEKIMVKFSGKIGKKIEFNLSDSKGSIVEKREILSSQQMENEIFNVKKIPSGIYILSVKAEGKLQTGKFFKD